MTRRLLTLTAIAVLVWGLLAPAPVAAQEVEWPPSDAEAEVAVHGGNCYGILGRPWHAQVQGGHYLRAEGYLTCSAFAGYTITYMRVEGRLGAAACCDNWHTYSASPSFKNGVGVPGQIATVDFDPFQDVCNWGGDWNRYRSRFRIVVTIRHNSTGTHYTSGVLFLKRTLDKYPCGDHE